MISVVALVRSKPGTAERVRIGLESLIAPTRAEAGNMAYVIHVSEDPNLFVSYEQWGSREALDAHMHMTYVLAFLEHCADAFAVAPELHILKPIAGEVPVPITG